MFDAMDDDLMELNRAIIGWFMSPWRRLLERRALARLSVADVEPAPDRETPAASVGRGRARLHAAIKRSVRP